MMSGGGASATRRGDNLWGVEFQNDFEPGDHRADQPHSEASSRNPVCASLWIRCKGTALPGPGHRYLSGYDTAADHSGPGLCFRNRDRSGEDTVMSARCARDQRCLASITRLSTSTARWMIIASTRSSRVRWGTWLCFASRFLPGRTCPDARTHS